MEPLELLPGTVDLLILKALGGGPRHGYAVAKWIKASSKEALGIEDRALYIALHRLEGKKLIRGRWCVTSTGRRAKCYELTEAGEKRLASEMSHWQQYVRAMGHVLRADFAEEA